MHTSTLTLPSTHHTHTAHSVQPSSITWWSLIATITGFSPWTTVALATRWSNYCLSLSSRGALRGGGGVMRGGEK